MHSFTYRANALLTFSVTILAVMCGLASLSDNFNVPSPTAEIQVDEAAKMLESIRFSQEVVGFHGSMGNMFLSRFCSHGCDGQVSSSKLASLGAYCPNTAAMQHKIGVIQDAGKIIIVLNFNRFKRQPNGNDEVSLTLGISADLQSLFTWNTKQVFVFVAAEYETLQNSLNQVSLWDSIIPSKDHAKFSVQVPNKYRFVDQGSNLRGKEFNLTLHWHIMPKTGRMLADKIVTTGFHLPQSYR